MELTPASERERVTIEKEGEREEKRRKKKKKKEKKKYVVTCELFAFLLSTARRHSLMFVRSSTSSPKLLTSFACFALFVLLTSFAHDTSIKSKALTSADTWVP